MELKKIPTQKEKAVSSGFPAALRKAAGLFDGLFAVLTVDHSLFQAQDSPEQMAHTDAETPKKEAEPSTTTSRMAR
jgi:hypothetical protein